MHSLKRFFMGTAAIAALGLGGAAIAGAAGGSGDGDGEKADDGPDAALTGSAAREAGTAAARSVGGRVVSVERSDEGGPAVYEVKVDKAGRIIEVQLAADRSVVGQKADDDTSATEQDAGDGDGEAADDAAGKQDAGDGDGEHADG